MRSKLTLLGVETAMLDCSYAQAAKSLGMPTHTYLGATDSKLVDAPAGVESGISAMVGAVNVRRDTLATGFYDALAQ